MTARDSLVLILAAIGAIATGRTAAKIAWRLNAWLDLTLEKYLEVRNDRDK